MPQRDLEKNHIAELRERARLTQVQLAKRLGTTGNTISRLETGKTRLSHEWMVRIASILGCKPSALIDKEQLPLAQIDQSQDAIAGLLMAIEIVKEAKAPAAINPGAATEQAAKTVLFTMLAGRIKELTS